jgi:hypothetical protein
VTQGQGAHIANHAAECNKCHDGVRNHLRNLTCDFVAKLRS